jgi:hypothetical protein
MEESFVRLCAHKAYTGIRLVAEALKEIEMHGAHRQIDRDAFEHSKRCLQALNLMLNVLVVRDDVTRNYNA